MAVDPFKAEGVHATAPAQGAFAITPNDSTDLTRAIRMLTIGTAGGTVAWQGVDGVTQTTGPLPVGTYVMSAHRILAAGTTATGLTGWI